MRVDQRILASGNFPLKKSVLNRSKRRRSSSSSGSMVFADDSRSSCDMREAISCRTNKTSTRHARKSALCHGCPMSSRMLLVDGSVLLIGTSGMSPSLRFPVRAQAPRTYANRTDNGRRRWAYDLNLPGYSARAANVLGATCQRQINAQRDVSPPTDVD